MTVNTKTVRFNIAERISESLFNYFNEQGLSNNSLRLSKSMKKGLEAGNLILHELCHRPKK